MDHTKCLHYTYCILTCVKHYSSLEQAVHVGIEPAISVYLPVPWTERALRVDLTNNPRRFSETVE